MYKYLYIILFAIILSFPCSVKAESTKTGLFGTTGGGQEGAPLLNPEIGEKKESTCVTTAKDDDALDIMHRLNRRYHENDLFEHLIQAVLISKAITYQELIAQN